jgi:hypothetical protein
MALAAAMMVSAAPASVMAAGQTEISVIADNGVTEEYEYVYAGLTWAQYWEAEGVMAAGNTDSSDVADSRNELDKGGFDAVSRATTNHGLHRGSYQCETVIDGESGKTYEISYWENNSTIVLTDGSKVTFNRGAITLSDGTTDTMTGYRVNGIKYVPVKVKKSDYEEFCKNYQVVENGGTLAGGYSEQNLAAYTATAAVSENTNGLKTAVKNEDGSFSFTSRTTGSDSGVKDTELAKAENITYDVKKTESDTPGVGTTGAYGEFLRVDLTGEGYGSLGAAMQAVKWTYYGNDSSRTNALASYGTKFAADNWMHKSNGIQLGLTESIRCQLPEGYDGTGYWSLTVYALGYEDYTVDFEATQENILSADAEEADTTRLAEVIAQAKGLNEADYTVDSWKQMQLELEESEELIEDENCTQAAVDEQLTHLENAIKDLVKKAAQTIKTDKSSYSVTYGAAAFSLNAKANGTLSYKSSNKNVVTVDSKGKVSIKGTGTATITVTAAGTDSYKVATKTVTIKVAPKKQTVALTSAKKKNLTVQLTKDAQASGYEIQVSTNSSFTKATTKTYTISSYKTYKKTITSLKSKKKYYVRVRSYKTSGTTKIYGAYSAVKNKKVK